MRQRLVKTLTTSLLLSATLAASPQLGSRPADEWVKTLDGPARVSALKIDEVVAAMKLQAGQKVADIGAGTGLFEVPLARAVGSTGRVYAEDIDAGFFPMIRTRAADAQLTNVETVLGGFTDPKLPVKDIDTVLIHDVDAPHREAARLHQDANRLPGAIGPYRRRRLRRREGAAP